MDAGQMSGPTIGKCNEHPDHKGAHTELAGANPDRQGKLEPLGNPGVVDDCLQIPKRGRAGHHLCRPESRLTAAASPTGSM